MKTVQKWRQGARRFVIDKAPHAVQTLWKTKRKAFPGNKLGFLDLPICNAVSTPT
jgi:hypothetical protein